MFVPVRASDFLLEITGPVHAVTSGPFIDLDYVLVPEIAPGMEASCQIVPQEKVTLR